MGDVLQLVHRLRKVQADHARCHVAIAEDHARQSQARLRQLEAQLENTHGAGCVEVISMQAYHQGALRLELERRAQSRRVAESETRAGTAREAYAHQARDAKLVELVADERAARTHAHAARQDQSRLDEQGLMTWWRRSA